MLANNPDMIQRRAWINYRGRLRETLSLLTESLEDADDPGIRDYIGQQIRRHVDYLGRAEKRISELANEDI